MLLNELVSLLCGERDLTTEATAGRAGRVVNKVLLAARSMMGGGCANPYLSLFEALHEELCTGGFDVRRHITLLQCRNYCNAAFGWAVPNSEAVRVIAEHGPIIEIGPGTGYLGRLLLDAGVDWIGFDNGSWNGVVSMAHAAWADVTFGTSTQAADHRRRTLLLSWPPMDDMASTALSHYEGSTVIYIGENDGGCTANAKFHEMLEQEWNEVRYVQIPQWWGLNDYMAVYKRKS